MISFARSMLIIYLTLFLFALYTFLIIYYWQSWSSMPEYVPGKQDPTTKFSVIIPARNEEQNINACMQSVCSQNYSPDLRQVIVVDDASIDRTWELISDFKQKGEVQGLHLEEKANANFFAYKKRAIQAGIEISENHVIVTTDADCLHHAEWLKTIGSFYEEKKSALIAAPVIYRHDSSVLQRFQALDFLVLQGITAASAHKNIHSMCNGANLIYETKAFREVHGFDTVDHIASGDDMLLMHKISKSFPGRVHYLKSKQAVVITQPMKTWGDFWNQRIRWSSKARFYDDKRISFILLLVYLFNLSFVALLIAGVWNLKCWAFLPLLLFAKTLVELPFVYSVARYFGQQSLVNYFLVFQPLHIAYTVVAGCLGQFRKYEWKGRIVR